MSGLIAPYRGIAPRIAPDAFIASTAVVTGDVEIGAEANIWFGCILRGDMNSIRVGARTNLQDGTIVHVNPEGGQNTVIGADVTVGHMAVIHACTLEDGAFVGMKACVLDGAVVEGGAMVAASALVTPGKRVRRGELWAGNPARLLRQLTPHDVEHFKIAVEEYVALAREYRAIAGAALRIPGADRER